MKYLICLTLTYSKCVKNLHLRIKLKSAFQWSGHTAWSRIGLLEKLEVYQTMCFDFFFFFNLESFSPLLCKIQITFRVFLGTAPETQFH